jgi:hypothetical protein
LKPRIFVGSSTEREAVAEATEVNLSRFADVAPWKHTFQASHNFLADLFREAKRCDFAVLVLTADDLLISRDVEYRTPRDNVLFELGLFIGQLGTDRVFALVDEAVDTKILSDYAGISILTYNGRRDPDELASAVSPACIKIKAQVNAVGSRPPNAVQPSVANEMIQIGIQKIYPNYTDAEPDIMRDMLKSSGPIRLFFQIASQSVNTKGTLFDTLDELVRRSQAEIRVLHAGVDSPLFSPDRLLALGKHPSRVLTSLRHVDESLRDLEAITNSSLRRRRHDYPFIWRMYGFGSTLYLMPYFSEKDAANTSPVLAFERRQPSLYQAFTDWFDYAWGKAAPDSMVLDQIITPATPCGTALFLKWGEFHVFGIPKRDLIDGSEYVRFYGIGGKRKDPNESLENCALREANEEVGGAVEELKASLITDFYRSNGIIERIELSTKGVRPRLLFEKGVHTGFGLMKPDDDYYYMVGYDAGLKHKPAPSGEVEGLLFLNDHHLDLLSRRNDLTLGQIINLGAQLLEQKENSIKRRKILVPHGTASYLMRRHVS